MSKIKKLKVKISDSEFDTPVSLGADAVNVDMADGKNAEDAINARVTQDFSSSGFGEAALVDADTVSGESINSIYSKFVELEVPAAVGQNSNDLYYASVSVQGITSDYALMGIQMSHETAIDANKEAAALAWDYLETGTDLISFYGVQEWTSPFTIQGVLVYAGGDS